MNSSHRGVSTVVGFILLVGLAAVGATTVAVVGMSVVDDTGSQLDQTRALDSLQQFAADMDTLANGADQTAFQLQGDRGDVAVHDGGRIIIEHTSDEGTETLINESLQALVYDTGRTQLVYQSGGIWRIDRNGGPLMLRPPAVDYRTTNEGTMTVDVIQITDGYASDMPARGTAAVTDRQSHHPTNAQGNPLQNGTIETTIDSEFCPAWSAYLQQRTSGAVVEGCTEGTDNRLQAEFTVPFVFNGAGQAKIEDPSATPVTWLVDAKAAACDESFDDGGELTSAGLHCTDSAITDTLIFNTTAAGGAIEVYAGDGIDISSDDINVIGPHSATIYADGDIAITGNSVVGNSSDPTQTRLFLSKTANITDVDAGTPEMYALIYGPESTMEFKGNVQITGAVIGGSIDDNGNVGYQFDEEFEDLRIVEEGAGPPFYYLHIERTKVTLSDQ